MSDRPSGGETDGYVIDADLRMQHAGMDVVSPFMEEGWRHYLGLDEDLTAHSSFRFHLPSSSYAPPPSSGDASAHDAVAEYLEANNIRWAILNSGTAARISGFAYTDASAAIARATNDWLIGEWLGQDERFLGSLVISARDPDGAAAEIARLGGHPRIVQVSLAYPQDLLGHRRYLPIYEAAAANGLTVNLDAGGGFVGVNRGYTGSGHPASAYELRVASALSVQPHLVNVICEGVFDRVPDLRLTITGSSVVWLPAVAAIMDAEYRRGQVDARLRRRPSEYLGDFVKFTTSPADWDAPNQARDLLSTLNAGGLLLYGSGPEFNQQSAPGSLLGRLPRSWRPDVAAVNASCHYQLPANSKASASVSY
jgi:uncharacterized protein